MANEFRLLPGTLPDPYCFTSWQQTYADFFNLGQIIAVNGSRFYNLGDAEPVAELRDFPWFRTLDGYWYYWSTTAGAWVRPFWPLASSKKRILWVGSIADLTAEDGGDANPVGFAAGPFWEVDTLFADRLPIGVGAIVPAVLGTAGSKDVTLAAGQVPPHSHYFGVEAAPSGGHPDLVITDGPGHLRVGGGLTVQWFSDENTTHGAQTRSDGPGLAAPSATTILNPVIGVYWIKRTARIAALPV